jgi:gluconate 2-dehydrogenase subunit 3-like protein
MARRRPAPARLLDSDPPAPLGAAPPGPSAGHPMSRREAVELLAVAPVAAAFSWAPASAREAAAQAREALARGVPYEPKQLTPHEWETVRLLVDIILPKDERSGSATDAGVPEFMDFMLGDDPDLQTPIRGGLAWLDRECDDRFYKTFVTASDAERTAILEDIAWPKKAKPEHSAGVAFFNSFRDFTASGFFSSKMGVEDIRYLGNTVVMEWKGCPPEALAKLGVRYDG